MQSVATLHNFLRKRYIALFSALLPNNANNAFGLQSIYFILEEASSKFAKDLEHSTRQLCQEPEEMALCGRCEEKL